MTLKAEFTSVVCEWRSHSWEHDVRKKFRNMWRGTASSSFDVRAVNECNYLGQVMGAALRQLQQPQRKSLGIDLYLLGTTIIGLEHVKIAET